MPRPPVNVQEVSQGIIGVMAAMMVMLKEHGNDRVAEFIEKVPERGSKLWDRFRAWQKEDQARKETGFGEFFEAMLAPPPQA